MQLRDFDEVDGLTIRLKGMKCILLVDFGVVVQGTEDNFVVFRKLLYLVESPQLVSFLKRIRDAGQEYKDFHLKTNWGTKIGKL